MVLLNIDRESLFLACPVNKFHIFGSPKQTLQDIRTWKEKIYI